MTIKIVAKKIELGANFLGVRGGYRRTYSDQRSTNGSAGVGANITCGIQA